MSRARVAGVLLVVAAALCVGPAVAQAEDVSIAEWNRLTAAAPDDPSALAELRGVDAVEGQPVDVAGALRGARGGDLERRLRTLASSRLTDGDVRDPRQDARDVLSERCFQQNVRGPFRGLLERIGNALPDLGWLGALFAGWRWVVLAVVAALVAWLLSRRVLGRRIRDAVAAAGASISERDDPRALDRQAAAAEAEGDLETALRLRFRAGLLRLDARGAITFRPSISTHEVRRALRSESFDALAATFDDVVYGGRPPSDADVAAARDRWPAIIKGSDPATIGDDLARV